MKHIIFPDAMPWQRSLATKLMLLSLLWLMLAMVSIGFTLHLSWKLEGGAAAINDAGSLRKRTYHLAYLIASQSPAARIEHERQDFRVTLNNLRQGDPARPLFLPDNPEVHRMAALIDARWQNEVHPYVQRALRGEIQLTAVDFEDVVNDINLLVHLIELDNARNTTLLRFFQTSLIAMALIGCVTMLYLLYLLVIQPVRQLGAGMRKLHDGDLGARVKVASRDEFGVLSEGFNEMARRLQDLYANLEDKVREKTLSVEEKNRQLTALYQVTSFLHRPQTQTLDEMGEGFLQRVMALVGADAASLKFVDAQRGKLDQIVSVGLPDSLNVHETCVSVEQCPCGAALKQALPVAVHLNEVCAGDWPCRNTGFASLAVFHVRYHGQNVALLTLLFRTPRTVAEPDANLIETLASHLGTAIESRRLAERERQLAVAEERNLMAQGLHDSIAQSLSFLNLQVQMLESALEAGESEAAQENLAFIREGVAECYEDVRELLLNFRTRISKEEFPDAVRTLLARFEQQARVLTHLQLEGEGLPLNPEQQLQVIFILQEALSNIRKHAAAGKVEVNIRNGQDFEMDIVDDGYGFDQSALAARQARHVGLSIMRERATRIAATVDIMSRPGEGTRVSLVLPHKERALA